MDRPCGGSSPGRARASQARGSGFKSRPPLLQLPMMGRRCSHSRRGGSDLGMGGIPLEGSPEARAQLDLRLPADPLADLPRVEVLPVDLPARVTASLVIGLHLSGAELAD